MKIGIMGGTFNPIHLGHLIISEYIRCNFPLDKVIFIPTGDPPHKNEKDLAQSNDRYNMTEMAIKSNSYFEISPIEINRKGKSYSTETIDILLKENFNNELYFIIGSDTLIDLINWKDIKNIFKKISFIVIGRDKLSDELINKKIEEYRREYNSSIFYISGPQIEISSTMIRDNIKNNKSIKYLVPKEVEEYIKTHKLYIMED